MIGWRRSLSKLHNLFAQKQANSEFTEEVQEHLELLTERFVAQGMNRGEAEQAARRQFGNVTLVEQQQREGRGWPEVGRFLQDVRYAIRMLIGNPGFTIVALTVIAVGIGVNTAVFSVVNAVLLKPLTYPDPEALVKLETTSEQGPIPVASIPEFNIWQQQSAIFQQVASYDWGGAGINLTGGGHTEQVVGAHVSSGYFSLFGAPVIVGRTFTAAEDRPNGGRVVVLSYGLWKERFGGDPKVVGSAIQVNDQSYLVIGIIGREFVTDTPVDLWMPSQLDLNSRQTAGGFNVAARLKPGVGLSQANAQLALAAEDFRHNYGVTALPPHGGFKAVSLRESLVGDTRFPLIVMLTAVAFVLLIACANVANLLLARASVRKRELAIRAALGAGRGRIIRQLLTESLMLSALGGLLGLAIGFGGVRLLLRISPGDIPRIGENGAAVGLDPRVLLFTISLSVLTGVVFGLAPAITASRLDLVTSLSENSGRSAGGLRHGRIRSLLVAGEMALALVLIIGAVLLARTFLNLQSVNPGFTIHNVLSASMSLSGNRFQRTAPVAQIVRDGRARLLSVPGVLEAGASACLPLRGCFGMGFDVAGRPKGQAPSTGVGGLFSISPGYFSTFQIPVIHGRSFTEQDSSTAPRVAIINQAMARQYWPNGDPLADHIMVGAGGPGIGDAPRQIIGIVGDTRDAGVSREPFPTMYIPIAQMPDTLTALNSHVAPLWWLVRTRTNPYGLRTSIEAALRDASSGLGVAHVRTMEEVEIRTVARQRFNMVLLNIFGLSGLLMASVGIYGVISYSVQQRTHEMGVRLALGAQVSDLRNMILGQGMMLTLGGVAAGLGAAFWLTRFLATFLFGVKTWDPSAFVLTPLLLSGVALLAVWIPARRAMRVDPMTSLRQE